MHPFGGTPRCPKCDGLVYAAEQVMGPGRKIYHKPCLKCTACSRRLDSLSLLEHNQEPYCKPCHVKNFGTRDLRSANLSPVRASSPPARTLSPTLAPPLSEEPEEDGDADEAVEDPAAFDPVPRTALKFPPPPAPLARPLSPLRSTSPARSPSPTKATFGLGPLRANMTGPVRSGSAPAPTVLRANVTGSHAVRPSPGGSPRKMAFSATPTCPKCGKAVFFAEQVKAAGQTWHRPCLRCTLCAARLDSTRITEKDGEVMCRNCYGKHHGPQGSGYALLGTRAG